MALAKVWANNVVTTVCGRTLAIRSYTSWVSRTVLGAIERDDRHEGCRLAARSGWPPDQITN